MYLGQFICKDTTKERHYCYNREKNKFNFLTTKVRKKHQQERFENFYRLKLSEKRVALAEQEQAQGQNDGMRREEENWAMGGRNMGDNKATNDRWAGEKAATARNTEAFRTPTSQSRPATEEAKTSNTRSLDQQHKKPRPRDESRLGRGSL